MSKNIFLGLAGPAHSGKSTTARILAEKHGLELFEGSALIRAEAELDGIQLSKRSDYDRYFRQLQHSRGRAWLSEIVLSAASGRAMQVGLRNKDDAKNFQRTPGGIIVALTCSPEVGFSRVNQSDPKYGRSLEAFKVSLESEDSSDEFGNHLQWVLDNADYTVDAERSQAAVMADLDAIISSH